MVILMARAAVGWFGISTDQRLDTFAELGVARLRKNTYLRYVFPYVLPLRLTPLTVCLIPIICSDSLLHQFHLSGVCQLFLAAQRSPGGDAGSRSCTLGSCNVLKIIES